MLAYYLRFVFRLLFHRPDLVYFTLTPCGGAFVRDSLFVFLAKFFHVRVVVHLHGKGICSAYSSRRTLYNQVFSGLDVIVLSERLRSDVDFLPLQSLYVLNNGISLPLKIQKRESFNVERSGVLRLLYFSVVTESKGIYDLFDALALLEDCPFCLTVIGPLGINMHEADIYSYIESKNLQGKVSYIGSVYGDAKYEFFLENDIFVLPSHNDAFPLVLLEALGMGLPCISTYVGGIPDIVVDGQTGFLYEAGDVQCLSDLILRFFDVKLLQRMSRSAQNEFQRRFTKEIFETNFCTILDTIFAKSKF